MIDRKLHFLEVASAYGARIPLIVDSLLDVISLDAADCSEALGSGIMLLRQRSKRISFFVSPAFGANFFSVSVDKITFVFVHFGRIFTSPLGNGIYSLARIFLVEVA